MKKIFAILLSLMIMISAIPASLAAPVADATIDETAEGSLTIFKYDFTNAMKDGVWNEDSFVSTGWRESYVETVLGSTVREGDANGEADHALGNGQTSNGYAIKGVEFTIAKVAEIVTFTESANDMHPDHNLTQVLYGFDKVASADLLAAMGLADGANRYINADSTDKLDNSKYYYTSNIINKALVDAINDNATTLKNAMEAFISTRDNAIALPLTDENGMSRAEGLDLGLWLCMETAVPEMVTSTTDPFFISLPMTTVSGNENSASPAGGTAWNYDVVIYPKNHTGIPSLEKTLRESKEDTGKNNGTTEITDGFEHTGTASSGDKLDYQILSTLPTITSKATSLSVYNFYDTLSEGLTYCKNDVKIEFFVDKECTEPVAVWEETDGKFTVTYSEDNRHMTIDMTSKGLSEINSTSITNAYGKVYTCYSNYTMRISYGATVNADDSLVYGENGNDNKVVLTWKRTSTEYYDTLVDDCHVFSFGIDLTKLFEGLDSESAEILDLFSSVKFKIYNETDGYWVQAQMDEESGYYYVTGHVAEEADGTVFVPITVADEQGKIFIKGLEDDSYVITEIETADGYTLLKDDIKLVITALENEDCTCDIYSEDILGVLQNDPHYAFDGGYDLKLSGMPQKQLHHLFLTAEATVDTNAVTMEADGESLNAFVPLTIVNTEGFDLPNTGDNGTLIFTAGGIMMMVAAVVVIMFVSKKPKNASANASKK